MPPHSDAVAAHLVHCAACRAEAELLLRFDRAEAGPHEEADLAWLETELGRQRPGLPGKRRWWQMPALPKLAAGLTVLLVTAGLALQWRGGPVRPLDEPASVEGTVRSSNTIRWIDAASGDIPALPARISWTPVEGATYTVELLSVEEEVLWSSAALRFASLELSGEETARIQPLRTLSWRVRAWAPDGKQIAESPRLTFRIGTATR